ncbi:acetyl-CoA carboxylase biotin carboxylase subunit family protein [Streptomyces goshikiensis]|uniref:ATP-grasp domain-containing protein n=1 Tax=Streptomyces goshikiensis TaxID=1942 RepID=UPI0036F62097
MTRLVVVVARSAVTPGDLLVGVEWCDEVLFVGEQSDYVDSIAYLLENAGSFVPIEDDEEALTRRIGAFAPDGIVTFSEHMLPLTARIAERLSLRFHTPDTVIGLRDKTVQRERLRSAGTEEMRARTFSAASDWPTVLEHVGLPLVLKPRRGEGSRDTHLVTGAAQGTRLVTELLAESSRPGREFIAEEYLVGCASGPFGDYVSVESIVCDGRMTHLGVTGKLPLLPPFRETGQFYPSGLPIADEKAVLDLASAAAAALGVTHGVLHTEIKLAADGPRVIEVNGRIGGYIHELYSRAWATDIVELVTRAACGAAWELPAIPQTGVHFQHTSQPHPQAVRFLGVEGSRTVARMAGIRGYRRLARPDSELPGDSRTHDLDLLSGWAPSHDAMLALLDECRRLLVFRFDSPGGVLRTTGQELATSGVAGG